MNNLYHWHDEKMVELRMQELNHEVENARLLKEAGLSNQNWLVRLAQTLGRWFMARRQKRQERASAEVPAD